MSVAAIPTTPEGVTTDNKSMTIVLKFAYRHSVHEVEEYDDLDDALASAHYAADAGLESLDRIEVFEEGQEPRVLSAREIEELNRPRIEAEMAEWSAAPPAVAMLEIANGKGEWARYSSYADIDAATTRATELRAVLGDSRVRVMPWPWKPTRQEPIF